MYTSTSLETRWIVLPKNENLWCNASRCVRCDVENRFFKIYFQITLLKIKIMNFIELYHLKIESVLTTKLNPVSQSCFSIRNGAVFVRNKNTRICTSGPEKMEPNNHDIAQRVAFTIIRWILIYVTNRCGLVQPFEFRLAGFCSLVPKNPAMRLHCYRLESELVVRVNMGWSEIFFSNGTIEQNAKLLFLMSSTTRI